VWSIRVELDKKPDGLARVRYSQHRLVSVKGQFYFDLNMTTCWGADKITLTVVVKKVIEEGGLPKPMTGGFARWKPLTISVGTYEYKVYVTDVLVAVFPFEVR
jgi:hypothetical protein